MFLFNFALLMVCCATVFCFEVDLSFQEKFQDGETRYKELVSKGYGSCWHEALSNLHSGCKHLTEEIQSRLALSFTNCFLDFTGSPTCVCPNETPISSCLNNSSDRVFSTYTEFYTHTQSICHYLQHREWQQQTEKTVKVLSENAEIVREKLDDSIDSLSKVLDMQKVASFEQKKLLSKGRALSEELLKSKTHAINVFEDFKTSTNEQRLLIFAVFDRVKSLQNLVLGEFTTIYTIAYYTASIFVIYILTSLPQTANARLWLMLLILANAVVERSIASYSLDEEMSKTFPLENNGPMYSRIWICRKITCLAGLSILIYVYYNYKDYNAINNKLLQEIQQQNIDLQQFIKSIKIGGLTSTPINSLKNEAALSREVFNRLNTIKSIPVEIPNNTVNSLINVEANVTPKTAPLKLNRKSYKHDSTPKENIALCSIENFNETGSSHKRYNLRSRTNSPAQSPNGTNLSSLQAKNKASEHF